MITANVHDYVEVDNDFEERIILIMIVLHKTQYQLHLKIVGMTDVLIRVFSRIDHYALNQQLIIISIL